MSGFDTPREVRERVRAFQQQAVLPQVSSLNQHANDFYNPVPSLNAPRQPSQPAKRPPFVPQLQPLVRPREFEQEPERYDNAPQNLTQSSVAQNRRSMLGGNAMAAFLGGGDPPRNEVPRYRDPPTRAQDAAPPQYAHQVNVAPQSQYHDYNNNSNNNNNNNFSGNEYHEPPNRPALSPAAKQRSKVLGSTIFSSGPVSPQPNNNHLRRDPNAMSGQNSMIQPRRQRNPESHAVGGGDNQPSNNENQAYLKRVLNAFNAADRSRSGYADKEQVCSAPRPPRFILDGASWIVIVYVNITVGISAHATTELIQKLVAELFPNAAG